MQIEPRVMSNLQLELLKLYTRDVAEQDLMAIRYMIGLYFAEKVTDLMDNFASTQELSSQQLANWAYGHWRSQNRS